MAVFPKIQSPCPYKGPLAEIMDGDICRLCKREVVDLTAFNDAERLAFLSGCAEEVCVSYRIPLRVAAAAALAVATLGAPAMAAAQELDLEEEAIVVGGIKDPANVEYIVTDDGSAPELPVIYEDTEWPADESEETSTTRTDLNHRLEAKQTREL